MTEYTVITIYDGSNIIYFKTPTPDSIEEQGVLADAIIRTVNQTDGWDLNGMMPYSSRFPWFFAPEQNQFVSIEDLPNFVITR